MIVITAPTGDIGHQVIANLLESGAPVRVIARDPSRIASETRLRVEVVQGSHSDAAVLERAFAGADAVLWLVPPNFQAASVAAAYIDFTRPAVEAIKRQGVKRVVGISALGRGLEIARNAGFVTATHASDDLIASTGVSFRALTMPSFMENLLNQVQPIKAQGMFFSSIAGDHKAPTCATRDVAAVATRLLLDSSWSGQQEVPVLGPEDLSFNDMAAIMSDVLGKPVRFQQIPDEALRSRMANMGASDAMAQAMIDMMVAKNKGLDNGVRRTPQTSTPTTFRKWCEDTLKPAIDRDEAPRHG
jgi:uncharacterized protein YbjT (DUF2867 family)